MATRQNTVGSCQNTTRFWLSDLAVLLERAAGDISHWSRGAVARGAFAALIGGNLQ